MTPISVLRDPVVRLTGAMTLVLALPLVVPILPPEMRSAYGDLFTTIPYLLVALGTFRSRLAEAEDADERRFWALMTAAVGCWLGQQVLLIATYAGPFSITSSLLEDLLYLGCYLFLVLALDVRPYMRLGPGHRGALARLRRAGTVVFFFGLLTYLLLVPVELDPASYWAGLPSFALYLLLDAYLVLRISQALAGMVDRRWRLVYGWLLATCSAWLVLDTVEALLWTEVLPWVGSGTPWDLPWMVPLITLVLVGHAPALAAEVHRAPAPETGSQLEDATSLGSPLILLAMLVPLLHFSVYGLEVFDESTKRAHELVALGQLLILGGLIFAYQRTLENRNRRLELERRKALARVEHQAYHDPLTALPNRRLLEDRAGQAMAQADRRDERLAILFFDLDGFKSINDSAGHLVGDELLRQIGQHLASQVRASDTVARVGGDEFVVLMTHVPTPHTATQVATKIQKSLDRPFEAAGAEHRVTASVGISLYPDDGKDLSTLIRSADSAMYQAKGRRPDKVRSGRKSA